MGLGVVADVFFLQFCQKNPGLGVFWVLLEMLLLYCNCKYALTTFGFWIQANDDPLWYRQHKGPVWTKGTCAILLWWKYFACILSLIHALFFPGWFQPHQEQPTMPIGTVVTSEVQGLWILITMCQRICFPFLLLCSLEVWTPIHVPLVMSQENRSWSAMFRSWNPY